MGGVRDWRRFPLWGQGMGWDGGERAGGGKTDRGRAWESD